MEKRQQSDSLRDTQSRKDSNGSGSKLPNPKLEILSVEPLEAIQTSIRVKQDGPLSNMGAPLYCPGLELMGCESGCRGRG